MPKTVGDRPSGSYDVERVLQGCSCPFKYNGSSIVKVLYFRDDDV